MKVTSLRNETTAQIYAWKEAGLSIGFVPTMGALHEGHLSLIRQAHKENEVVVCSIFVNPVQFNNPSDLEKYPRTMEADLDLLEKEGCDLVFAPDVDEMYPEQVTEKYDFGNLELVLEGKFRPGHFNGVGIVVSRLFDIIMPDNAYFGEKDYQQILIIKQLVKNTKSAVNVIPCPIIRESDGLAMSSRNKRLTEEQRGVAPFIFKILTEAQQLSQTMSPEDLVKWGENVFNNQPEFKLDYFQISDNKSLMPILAKDNNKSARLLVAAYLGEIRLIDNVLINF